MSKALKIIECPRDAMQGIEAFIPTKDKIAYINSLLDCGFDTLDFGSFVSPKSIPQMRDTAEVLQGLNTSSKTKLLAIIANYRGAEDALEFQQIDFLGYPFSISEQFQLRNTNATLLETFESIEKVQDLVRIKGKKLVVYLSMGFGNPYGEAWSPEIALHWSNRLVNELGVEILALSDTIGCANTNNVTNLFTSLSAALPQVELGAHFHMRPGTASPLLTAAYDAGCRRFDTAFKGMGGCPMAQDDLIGNLDTEEFIAWLSSNNLENPLNLEAFEQASKAASIFFN
jgi:hydroxymethylglutaryl-CoA lyase